MCQKLQGFNAEVDKAFSLGFDGNQVKVCFLEMQVTDEFIIQFQPNYPWSVRNGLKTQSLRGRHKLVS